MDKYKFGEFIYTQRKKQNLTQEELGRRLKVTNKAVSKWETGETLPDVLLLEPLAKELNVTIDELLTQQKPNVEKVYIKPKVFPYIIMGVSILILLCVVSILSIKIALAKNETITTENANKYFEVNICETSILNEQDLTINGSITPICYIKNPVLSIDVNIQYYYLNTSDELCEILYLNKSYTYDGSSSSFSFTVSPKNTISDFKTFYGFNVSYTIVEVKGELIDEK
jgi:transcriptional regulator with XRE-family HTH domain